MITAGVSLMHSIDIVHNPDKEIVHKVGKTTIVYHDKGDYLDISSAVSESLEDYAKDLPAFARLHGKPFIAIIRPGFAKVLDPFTREFNLSFTKATIIQGEVINTDNEELIL